MPKVKREVVIVLLFVVGQHVQQLLSTSRQSAPVEIPAFAVPEAPSKLDLASS